MRTIATTLFLAALIFTSGCKSCCKRKCNDCGQMPIGASIGSPSTIPPAGIAPSSSYYPPRSEILLPESRPANSASPPRVEEKPANSSAKPPKPDTIANKAPSEMPLGITDFTVIKDGVWTGLRPDLDGLDWLKQKQVQRVVFLRTPGDDDASDRQQVEKRGMVFESLVVGTATLDEDLYRKFEKFVNGTKPVFVYDRAGETKGYLWYAYLRVNDMQSPEVAKLRAERLGYNTDRKELALATNKIVDNIK